MNGANFSDLEFTVLLRVLCDPRVEAVAIEHYGLAVLRKLIDQLAEVKDKPS